MNISRTIKICTRCNKNRAERNRWLILGAANEDSGQALILPVSGR